ncbi:autotransporter strand-loop-strand O-heptosyltransferase [Salmonella enterica]|nr:autotransporter strand-loop-strand O-heptosyltransferase [Salmonella enterica]EDN4742924.1 autotransporter strand-loop-strand O-heptosyltransferase [Salmonella enterica subsp. enterica serovar Oranienburg]EGM2331386.1 autotransporter strand-loop-strand O-heptosyltransferase [Salmonella enterica]EIX1194604.1 autotransporter strand-loop-strand O-heptosyltransferase [Salmonella enterica]
MDTTSSFLLPPEVPVCTGPDGILFDFNDGARVCLPEGGWHVRLLDDDAGNILFSCDSPGGWVTSTKKYFVRFRIQVFRQGETKPVLDERLDLRDKPVLILFPTGTLGDLLGWFHYAERFRQLHQCRLECVMGQEIIDLLAPQYPDILFSTKASVRTENPYASYRIGLFFGGDTSRQPVDFRKVGFHRNAGHILGVDTREAPPRLKLDAERKIPEPYVCIAVQSTCQAKYWNNGHGWAEVVAHLKSLGYRVLCIDRHARHGQGFVWNHIPYGAEDVTGSIPLQERVDLLRHASFFIGLGSGLSWLAWAAGIPVVLISGFSLPGSEFYTPWRVFSSHGCNGCWDDTALNFDHQDFLWCPRHKGTDRQYECTRLITGRQVNGVVDRLHLELAARQP